MIKLNVEVVPRTDYDVKFVDLDISREYWDALSEEEKTLLVQENLNTYHKLTWKPLTITEYLL